MRKKNSILEKPPTSNRRYKQGKEAATERTASNPVDTLNQDHPLDRL
jgi:hypothetical protein